MSKDALFWNRIADRYATSPVRDEAAYAYTVERVASYLSPDQTVMELGAGTGTTAIKLAPYVKSILVTDLAPRMLEIAKERSWNAGVDNLTTQTAAADQMPEGPFDVVMAFNLLHLVPDLTTTLAKVADRLPQGGLFISKTPCLRDTKSLPKRWAIGAMIPFFQLIGKAPDTVNRLRVSALDVAVQGAGFEIIETGNFPADPPSRFVVARKRSSVD